MAKGARSRTNRGLGPDDLTIFIGLILLSWVHRLFFLGSNLDASWPFTIFYEGDSETFYNYARAILNGSVYDGGVPFHPPAFPFFLSIVHTSIGAGPGVERVPYVPLKVCMAMVGSLPVGLGYLLARPYLGRPIALTGAMLAVYSFGLYVVAIAPVSESLYATLLLTSLLVWTRKLPHPIASGSSKSPSTSLGWGAVLGALLGLLCLTRAEGMLVALGILAIGACSAVIPASSRPPLWMRVRPWIIVAAAMIAVITPWTIRNALRLHAVNVNLAGSLARPLPEFVPITAYGPLNFALANNEMSQGTFSRDILTSQARSAALDIRDPQHLEFFLDGYEIGWRYIRENPARFLELVLIRWGLFFDSLRLGWTQWNLPGGLVGVRRPVDLFVPDSTAGLWLNAFLMLGGIAVLLRLAFARRPDGHRVGLLEELIELDPRRVRQWLWIVALVTGCGMITTGLFFGYARLGVMLLPIWFTLAASFPVAIGKWIARASRGRASERLLRGRTIGMAVILISFLIEAWGATGDRNYHATGTQAEGASHLNPHDTMHLEVISGSP